MEPEFEQQALEEEKIDLKKYYLMLRRRWWVILTVFLLVTVPWTWYVKRQPAIYEATALLRIKSEEYGSDPALNESRITELTSRSFAEKVVAQLGLTMTLDPELRSRTRQDIFAEFSTTYDPVPGSYILRLAGNEYQLLQIIEEEQQLLAKGPLAEIVEGTKTLNGFTFRLRPDLTAVPKEIPFTISRFRDAVTSLRERTNVSLERGGNLMSVSLTDRDPVLVTQMVNRLAEIFVEESLSLKRSHEQNVRRLLEEKLSVARETMERSDAALKEFKQSHFVSLDSEVQAQLNKLTESERAKTAVKRQIDDLADLFDQLNTTSAGADGDAKKKEELKYIYRQIANLAAFEGDPNMGVLKQRLADLEDQRAKLQRGENHPAVIALESQVDAVHAQIKKLALDRQKTLGMELEKLTSIIDSLKGKLRQLPEEERRLAELTRDRKVNEELYAMLLTETQKAQITEAVKTQDVDILDPAIEPEHPLNRDKKKKAALGAVFGLVLGIGLALGIELLDKSIKTAEDVKKYLKLPVLGNIPLIEFDEALEFQDSQKIKQIDSQLVTHDYSPTPIGEAYRSLRTNILFSKTTGRIKSMVITSSAPGDGKSFTATNLAIAIAQQKNNTLLVDADLRRGVLHNTFSVPKEPGLTNFLTNTASLLEIVNETHIPNLSLVSCGSLMPNPSELLGSPQMRKFLDDVLRRFDVVILDSPPLNAATDAVVVGTQVDGVAVVVRAGKTDRDVARQKLELFSHLPARVIGVVLNCVEPDMGHEGYSYYHY